MNDIEIIEKKAQIKILDYLMNSLCVGELPEAGRRAIRAVESRLMKEITDLRMNEIDKG